MPTFHCQICGRRVGQKTNGRVVHHHVRGASCLGSDYPPIEVSDERLRQMAGKALTEMRVLSCSLSALYERRANQIDSLLIDQLARAANLADTLNRRLTRHHQWPARFARQMQERGWGDPPPQYLLSDKERP